jgi:uncharacterized protein DUF1707
MRIGDAERDTATAELGDHFAAGRLTLDELHERVAQALSARTHGQLSRVMRDLPSLKREPRPRPGPARGEPLPSDGQRPVTASGDGRFAAIGLLLLAMLIWLFTVVVFTRHGYYYSHYPYPHHPYSPWHHP